MPPSEDVPLHIDIGTVRVRHGGSHGMFIELDPAFSDPNSRPRWMEAVAKRVEELNAEIRAALDERDEYAGWKVLQHIANELYRTQSQLQILLRFASQATEPDSPSCECKDIAHLSLHGGRVETDQNGQPFRIVMEDGLGEHPPAWLQAVMEKIGTINGELGNLRAAPRNGRKPSEDAWRTLQLLLRFLSRAKVQLELTDTNRRENP